MHSSRLHPFLRLCLCGLGLLGIQSLVSALCIAVVLLNSSVKGQGITLPEDFLQRYSLPLVLLSYPPSLLFIGFCRHRLDKASVQSLGLRPIRVHNDLLRGLIGGAAAIGFLWAIMWLTGGLQVKGWSPEFQAYGFKSVLPLLGFALSFGAVGVFEEVLFRGYIWHNLSGWLGWRAGIVLQAIFFAVVHLGNVIAGTSEEKLAAIGALPSIALVGLFFALSARKTGSLWFAIGFHAAWDFSLGCIYSLPVSGINTFRLLDVEVSQRTWLSGGSFGAEGSFLLIPILLALVVLMALVPDHPQTQLDLELSANKPEPIPQPALPDMTAPMAFAESEAEVTEEPRENRYRARFGSAEGFDSDMLRELRGLQEQREHDAKPQVAKSKAEEEQATERTLASLQAQILSTATSPQPSTAPSQDDAVVSLDKPSQRELQKTALPEAAPFPTAQPVVASPPAAPKPTIGLPLDPTPSVPPPKPLTPPAMPVTPTTSTEEPDVVPPSPDPKPAKKSSPRW